MVLDALPNKFVQTSPIASPAPANAAERQPTPSTPLQVLRAALQDGPKNPSAAELKADLEAHEIMRRAVRDNDQQMRADVVAYAQAIAAKSDQGTPLTIHEHTAVTYLLRCGMFDAPDAASASPEIIAADQKFNNEVRGSLTKTLANSWKNLTGKERAPDKLLTRLPKMVLRKASREARVYHAAAFIPMTADRAVRLKASSMFRDYVPENQDLLLGTGALLASVFTSAGRWAVGSTILQYVMYSVTENVLHDHLAHPKGRVGEWFQKGPGPTPVGCNARFTGS